MATNLNKIPSIPEFFCGKNIFITGGTGFIGKVLICKLLTTCPDIQNIYLLIRPKKGKNVEERLKDLTNVMLFDILKERNPEAFKKIIVIEGDAKKLDLGLNENDRRNLIENIHIVYHSSASVRFDDDLKDAILSNTRSTREISYLALEMKKLELLVDISTSYCHCEQKVIDEVLYPAQANWRDAIKMAEEMDSQTINALTAKYVEPSPNTYTFSKALSEQVINDLCVGKIPVIIVRPSIVIPSMQDPFPCWMENFNGPIGICAGVSKGIIRTLNVDSDIRPDYIPVDIVVRGLIAATWQEVVNKKKNERKSLTIYNATSNGTTYLSHGTVNVFGRKLFQVNPSIYTLWYPTFCQLKCKYYSYIRIILYQIIPAILIDGMLKLFGQKFRLLTIQRKIYIALMAVDYFMRNEWTFNNDNFRNLDDNLLEIDREEFMAIKLFKTVSWEEYSVIAINQSKKILLKERLLTPEEGKRHARRLWIISVIFDILFYAFFAWLLLVKIDILPIIAKFFENFIKYE